jgi:hypothetical protein
VQSEHTTATAEGNVDKEVMLMRRGAMDEVTAGVEVGPK